MTSLFPPFTRRASFRKQPFFYEAGRGVYYKSLGYSSPALNLDFTTGTLDSRITFSRGTNATLTDSTGKITYAPANILTYSQDYTQSAWLKNASGGATAPVVTGNYTTAPDGTNTASKVVFVAPISSDRSWLVQLPTMPTTVINYIGSLYIKADGAGDVGKVVLFRQVAGGSYTSITLTASWQRISSTETYFANNFEIALRPSSGSSTGTVNINLWGCQLEAVTYQTTPSTYVATTASAYYGPRFDYDPVTLQCKGLLIEEQRTNLLTYSNVDTNWSSLRAAISNNQIVSPTGTTTGSRIDCNATGGGMSVNSNQATISNGATVTASVYLKKGYDNFALLVVADATTSNGARQWVNINTGVLGSTSTFGTGWAKVGATVTDAGNGWYRVSFTVSTTGTIAVLSIFPSCPADGNANCTSGVTFGYPWGAQLETGAFATSYIPTTNNTVTRSADVASMTGSNFSSWYNQSAGSFFAQGDINAVNTVNTSTLVGPNSSSYQTLYLTAAASPAGRTWDGTNAPVTTNTVSANTSFKLINAYDSGGLAVCLNAGTVASSAYSGGFSAMAAAYFGSGNTGTGLYLNGHIASIQYYNKRLPNATLQALTK